MQRQTNTWSGLLLSAVGAKLLADTARRVIDSNPYMLAKAMQRSDNSEVREYGYRLEVSLKNWGVRETRGLP
jgi:hypothetical protein